MDDKKDNIEPDEPELAFHCKKCGRGFTKRKYLDQHMRRTTPCDVDLQCKKCFKTFQNAHKLKRHLDRVTPCVPVEEITEDHEEDHACPHCHETYASKSNLTRHLKICGTMAIATMFKEMMEILVEKLDGFEGRLDRMEQMIKDIQEAK